MMMINCNNRFDEHALHRWEAEGGCLGVMPQRGRDGPRSQRPDLSTRFAAGSAAVRLSLSPNPRTSLTVEAEPKGTSHVAFDKLRFENSVRSARSGQHR